MKDQKLSQLIAARSDYLDRCFCLRQELNEAIAMQERANNRFYKAKRIYERLDREIANEEFERKEAAKKLSKKSWAKVLKALKHLPEDQLKAVMANIDKKIK